MLDKHKLDLNLFNSLISRKMLPGLSSSNFPVQNNQVFHNISPKHLLIHLNSVTLEVSSERLLTTMH